MTDGVTEAQNAAGELYGHARAEQVIGRLFGGEASAREMVTALKADVLTFEEGAEPNDDLTLIALRWKGGGNTGAPAPLAGALAG